MPRRRTSRNFYRATAIVEIKNIIQAGFKEFDATKEIHIYLRTKKSNSKKLKPKGLSIKGWRFLP